VRSTLVFSSGSIAGVTGASTGALGVYAGDADGLPLPP
jgi:hypothetical protein